ncbi:putative membrane-anchored protein [Erwinia toletana]|uniref:Membrane-anchored protein n=1 Tax=Winslowiella toletana TaxID=92490 RepID=A0ABS4P9Z0_9GAMM|nr:hypothetical protein [Winslowiella toletana]MBP2169440.1 putative membrane-anchored protein [Winslowiella toletana]
MDKMDIAMSGTAGVTKIDIKEEEKQYSLTLKETDRLLFAKQVLLFIFIFSLCIVLLAAFFPDNELIKQMVDLIKIGVLPLITLIVSFYFPQSIKDSQRAEN